MIKKLINDSMDRNHCIHAESIKAQKLSSNYEGAEMSTQLLQSRLPYKSHIAISGKKGSGKTHLANEIKDQLSRYGFSVEIISIAEPIKEIVNILLYNKDVNLWKNHPHILDIIDCSAREALQKVGTVLKETFTQTLWVYILLHKIDVSKADYIIIDDLRFDAELETLNQCLCEVQHIHIDYKHQDNSDTHISENSISITDDTLVIERD